MACSSDTIIHGICCIWFVPSRTFIDLANQTSIGLALFMPTGKSCTNTGPVTSRYKPTEDDKKQFLRLVKTSNDPHIFPRSQGLVTGIDVFAVVRRYWRWLKERQTARLRHVWQFTGIHLWIWQPNKCRTKKTRCHNYRWYSSLLITSLS